MIPRLFLTAAVLLFPGGTLFPQGKPDPAALVKELGNSKDYRRCYRAYRALLRARPPAALHLLEKALPSFTGPALSYGVSLLRAYPRETGFPALRRLMKTGHPLLSFYCAKTLFRAGEREALPFLRRALAAAPDPSARFSMLGRIQGLKDRGIQELVRSWIRPGAGVPLVRAALTYLFSVEDIETGTVLKKLLENQGSPAEVKALCAAYLTARGNQGAGKTLAALLAAGKIPSSSFYTMIRFLKEGPRPPKEVLAGFLDLLEKEKILYARVYILELFGKFPFRPALPALRKLLEDKHTQVAQAAFDALAASPGALGPKFLHRLLAEGDPEKRLLAADTLRRMDDPAGLDTVLEMARKKGPLRRKALEILGKFRVNRAVPALLEALDDPDRLARQEAFYGLRTTLATLFPYRRLDLSSTGYHPDAPPARRRSGAALIRAWWEKNKNKDW